MKQKTIIEQLKKGIVGRELTGGEKLLVNEVLRLFAEPVA